MAFSGQVSVFHRKKENNLNQSIMQKKPFEGCTVQTLRYSAKRQMKASKALDSGALAREARAAEHHG